MSLTQGSPRLPSPPPPAEIQIGPKSPGLGTTANRQAQEMEQSVADANAKRRIHPGTKSEDMAAGPPLVPLNELDSAFQLQEHLAALHYFHTAHGTTPINRATAAQLTQPPPGIDRTLWLYELCRFLIAQCNSLIVGFLFDSPPCSSSTCPEMRASEWQFLCAVHDQPKSCCAIDYCCHTLDWAANVVTNPKLFPSRFVVVSDTHDKNTGLKNLVNVFRRLHRIFAHAWFQHRGVFWSVEAQTGLYAFFKTVCDMYDLLPLENYKLPPEAEGLEPNPAEKEDKKPAVTAIAKPPLQSNDSFENDDERQSLLARRSSTTRHSSRPSTGSSVTTVIEEREDENSDVTKKFQGMHISAPDTVEEESEVEVPVIVEDGVVEKSDNSETITEVSQPSEPTTDVQPRGVEVGVHEAAPEDTEGNEQEVGNVQEAPLLGSEMTGDTKDEQSGEKQPEKEDHHDAADPPSVEPKASDSTPSESAPSESTPDESTSNESMPGESIPEAVENAETSETSKMDSTDGAAETQASESTESTSEKATLE
ncbi:Mob1/phocein [Xylariomycetidae sp. FL0641]|nr:Mob1/phocein [Xylariomycetidae sp. FL0641]